VAGHAPLATAPAVPFYELQLYVAGASPNSTRAMHNIQEICEGHLVGRYALRIIDIYQQPQLARDAQIKAVPTLVCQRPLPCRQLIGDLSNQRAVLAVLGLAHLP
jgi:circadian clock protein KaiB